MISVSEDQLEKLELELDTGPDFHTAERPPTLNIKQIIFDFLDGRQIQELLFLNVSCCIVVFILGWARDL